MFCYRNSRDTLSETANLKTAYSLITSDYTWELSGKIPKLLRVAPSVERNMGWERNFCIVNLGNHDFFF